jgi:hypothetical protein
MTKYISKKRDVTKVYTKDQLDTGKLIILIHKLFLIVNIDNHYHLEYTVLRKRNFHRHFGR